ncbi:hypothetical protein [Chroococcidiopsis sp. SAG 2025]|uniref:hypothetical protein n=1 Tax=Chroococcidiopsis sp. SAG 2025 TaxID=171389 RepID=UPI002936E9E0|nr:hypothetical protein [Chroococcidiopsis sp. SAG 2025]
MGDLQVLYLLEQYRAQKQQAHHRNPIEVAAMQLESECDTAACSWLKQLGFKIPKE